MTADEVSAFIDSLPPDKKPEDGAALARELVRQKKLTKFQAQAIYQGKTRGLILDRYVVLDRIGQGGMGQVYKAEHKVMKRVVALKTLPPEATKSDRAVKRFHREVEVAARLSHPNIVASHDACEDHGIHFLVMEYVEGTDLARLVKQQGKLPVRTAIDYIIQAARGLEYAHNQNVIHRDIKPSNLVLDREGTIKILDMGLARLNDMIGADGLHGRGDADRHRPGHGHARLHAAGAGREHQVGGRAGGHLLSRVYALHAPDRPHDLPGRHTGGQAPGTS